MKSNSKTGGAHNELVLSETGLLGISVSSYRYIGKKQIRKLALVFKENTDVIEAAYLKALSRGERLPMILVGCGDRPNYLSK